MFPNRLDTTRYSLELFDNSGRGILKRDDKEILLIGMISLTRYLTGRLHNRAHAPILVMDNKPPRWSSSDDDVEDASKQAFTAYEFALRHGHHPKLWEAVKGSPFQATYETNISRQA